MWWNMMLFCLGFRDAAEAVVTCVVIPRSYLGMSRRRGRPQPVSHQSTLVLCTLLMSMLPQISI